jgi:ornithine cyclodeaminase
MQPLVYLNEEDIQQIGINWSDIIDTIHSTCLAMGTTNYAQPIKTYLRYGDQGNRIIAMPGFVGEDINLAGIKWIASFPGNLDQGKKRAHSITILNDTNTGEPKAILNTALISGIRTAGVSAFITQYWDQRTDSRRLKVGMTGFGPVGKLHLQMLFYVLGDQLEKFVIYDLRGVSRDELPAAYADRIVLASSWQEAFEEADVFVTCTVAPRPYVDMAPKKGSLHLNVSLRDYQDAWVKYADVIIVDSWEEVCREKTDIERMHLNYGLQKEHVYDILQVVKDELPVRQTDTVMFNPMGMSVFDIAIGGYFVRKASEKNVGLLLS